MCCSELRLVPSHSCEQYGLQVHHAHEHLHCALRPALALQGPGAQKLRFEDVVDEAVISVANSRKHKQHFSFHCWVQLSNVSQAA